MLAPFLVWSMDWRGSGEWTWDRIVADPHVSRYAADWGSRHGDAGVLAMDPSSAVQGAAWWRLFADDALGYGFVAPDIPEIGVAVAPDARGRGLGARLMSAVVKHARECGHRALSLSVEDGNDSARRLSMPG